jgi:hypothetical protein
VHAAKLTQMQCAAAMTMTSLHVHHAAVFCANEYGTTTSDEFCSFFSVVLIHSVQQGNYGNVGSDVLTVQLHL